MARFIIDHPAPAGGWDVVRTRLETALAGELPVVLAEKWREDCLELTGTGVRASIRLVDGNLRAEADLKPPASFFRSLIERELRTALDRAWPVDDAPDPTESSG